MCLTALKVDVDFRREGQISSKMDEGIDLENSKVSMRLYEGTGGDDDDIKIPFLFSSFRCSFSPNSTFGEVVRRMTRIERRYTMELSIILTW